MPKSRALKDETMPMMKETTMEDMMTEGREMMISAKNSMMRGKVMMAGAQAMTGKKKQEKKEKDNDTQYFDLGGMNFDPKKFKKGKK